MSKRQHVSSSASHNVNLGSALTYFGNAVDTVLGLKGVPETHINVFDLAYAAFSSSIQNQNPVTAVTEVALTSIIVAEIAAPALAAGAGLLVGEGAVLAAEGTLTYAISALGLDGVTTGAAVIDTVAGLAVGKLVEGPVEQVYEASLHLIEGTEEIESEAVPTSNGPIIAPQGSVILTDSADVAVRAGDTAVVEGDGNTIETRGDDSAAQILGSSDHVIVSGTNDDIPIGGNGSNVSESSQDVVTVKSGAGGTVTELDDSYVRVNGNDEQVVSGNDDKLGISGSGDTADITGSSTRITAVGSNNEIDFSQGQGGDVTELHDSSLTVSGDGETISVGNDSSITVNGSSSTITASDGDEVSLVGDQDTLNGSGVSSVSVSDGASGTVLNISDAELDLGSDLGDITINGDGDIITAGSDDGNIIVNGNNNAVSGTDDTVTFQGSDTSGDTTTGQGNTVSGGGGSGITLTADGYMFGPADDLTTYIGTYTLNSDGSLGGPIDGTSTTVVTSDGLGTSDGQLVEDLASSEQAAYIEDLENDGSSPENASFNPVGGSYSLDYQGASLTSASYTVDFDDGSLTLDVSFEGDSVGYSGTGVYADVAAVLMEAADDGDAITSAQRAAAGGFSSRRTSSASLEAGLLIQAIASFEPPASAALTPLQVAFNPVSNVLAIPHETRAG